MSHRTTGLIVSFCCALLVRTAAAEPRAERLRAERPSPLPASAAFISGGLMPDGLQRGGKVVYRERLIRPGAKDRVVDRSYSVLSIAKQGDRTVRSLYRDGAEHTAPWTLVDSAAGRHTVLAPGQPACEAQHMPVELPAKLRKGQTWELERATVDHVRQRRYEVLGYKLVRVPGRLLPRIGRRIRIEERSYSDILSSFAAAHQRDGADPTGAELAEPLVVNTELVHVRGFGTVRSTTEAYRAGELLQRLEHKLVEHHRPPKARRSVPSGVVMPVPRPRSRAR